MKKALCPVMVIFSILACCSACAEDYSLAKDVTFSADYAFYTNYVGKGFTYDEDPVLQAGFYIGYKGLTLTIWNSQDIRNQEGINSDEVDYCIEYAYTIEKLRVSVGHTYFDFSGCNRVAVGDDDYEYTNSFAKEVSVGIFYDTLLSPSVSWKHDYSDEDSGGGKGDYAALALAQSFAVNKGISLDLSGHVGYNDGYFLDGTGGDVALTAGVSVPLTGNLTFKPNVNYSIPYGDLADEQDNRFYAGVVMGYSL
ncbi:MAG: hypothetical protein AB1847_09210 [bacterium]